MVNVTAHKIYVRANVQISERDLLDIEFPFPLLTESGLPIRTETGKDISISGDTVAIPLVGGAVLPQALHVTTEG